MQDEGSRLFDETLIARRRLGRWVAAAAGVLLLVRLGAEVMPTMRIPDLALLDSWQKLRGTERPSPQIAIVAIDQKSIDKFGPPAWPRSEYVPLIERLSAAGAKVIGFDITFGALEREAANNDLLAAAMEKAGNVVFGYEFTRVGDPSPPGTPPSEAIQANAFPRFSAVVLPPAPSLIEPEPVLAKAAAALGHVYTLVSEEDGRMRNLALAIKHGDRAYPSLALQVARVYTGTSLQGLELTPGLVGMGEWDIPVSPSGEVLLNWPREGEQAFPRFSFLDVVRGDVSDEAFRGKAVLVGGTADGLDEKVFPFAEKAPGVLVHATFLDNVFRFDFVQAPLWAWILEWGLFIAVLGLGVWLLPRVPTRLLLAGVPVLVLLVLGMAAFLYAEQGLWLKVFYPCVAFLVPFGLVVALRLTASEKETRDVAAEKLENQKLLGLSFQEKGMLDMALATFNKLPFTEDMKHVYLNLGLDYENRGQGDKAFVVYKKVFDVDPSFEGVAVRMERLSQAGASPSLFAAPTVPGRTATPPAPATPRSPLSIMPTALAPDDLPTALSPDEAPTSLAPTQLEGGAAHTPGGRQRTPSPGAAPPRPQTPLPPTGPRLGPMPTPVAGGPVMAGSRFGQRYEVERHLGRGGMGDVYQVRDSRMKRVAALKTIRPDADLAPQQVIEMRQRFYREAETAGSLTHPNIVTVYDVGEDLGVSYIVMEFFDGQTLAQLMKKQRFTVAQIKHVVYHAAHGLAYAHENGVFHRDVKPDNIMVSKAGLVKVMDFGIAHVVDSELTKTGSVMGTPAYMSPEQVNGEKIDGRSDIFSLGVILYELLTGRKPFTGETVASLMFAIIKATPERPSVVDEKVSASWDEILRKALAKEREDRYATIREFAQAVRDAPVR